jgi:predicted alpha/beta hydrolase
MEADMQSDSSDREPPITSREGHPRPEAIQNVKIVTADRTALGGTLFEPSSRIRAEATVIIHGATATPQSYYRRFARYLAASGLRVLTYDYRGIGRSRPDVLRGYRATMTDWAKVDAAGAHAYVRERFDSSPVVVVGHSFGGQLFGLLDDVQDARGAVLVGAQLGYYGSWPLMSQLKLGLVWRAVVPSFTALWGYLPGKIGIGEDLPRGVAEEWARWCSHPDYLMGEHEDARARFARFARPVRLYSFTDDYYAPERAVRHLVACLRSTEVERVVVTPRDHGGNPIGHFGFFRPRFRDTLWAETVRYAKDVAADRAPRPAASGRRPPRVDAWKPFAGLSIDASDLD